MSKKKYKESSTNVDPAQEEVTADSTVEVEEESPVQEEVPEPIPQEEPSTVTEEVPEPTPQEEPVTKVEERKRPKISIPEVKLHQDTVETTEPKDEVNDVKVMVDRRALSRVRRMQ